MIEPQARDLSCRDQFQYLGVRGREHARVFHTDRAQMVVVEKPAVVDLVKRGLPVRQPIDLSFEEIVERVERFRMTRHPVHAIDGRLDECPTVSELASSVLIRIRAR